MCTHKNSKHNVQLLAFRGWGVQRLSLGEGGGVFRGIKKIKKTRLSTILFAQTYDKRYCVLKRAENFNDFDVI